MQPGKQGGKDSVVPQRHRLAQLSDSEPGRTAIQGSTGTGQQTVPVAVGLDHSHHGGRPGVFAQNLDIARDRVKIHGGTRSFTTHGKCQTASSQPTDPVRHGSSLPGSSAPGTINAATTPGMACATPSARTGPPGLPASPASP